MKNELESNASRIPGYKAKRQVGSMVYIDTTDEATAKRSQQELLESGVLVNRYGSVLSIKPALICEEKHVDQFVGALKGL